MKYLAISLLSFVVFSSHASRVEHIHIYGSIELVRSSTTFGVRRVGDVQTEVLYLWAPGIPSHPIGNAIISCRYLGDGGILGDGRRFCQGQYTLPLGKMTTQGVRESIRHFTAIITGGSRRYVGAAGVVNGRPISGSPAQIDLLFRYKR